MTETPQTDKCVKENKHLKFLQEDVWVNDNKITYENPIVALCQKLERERDKAREDAEKAKAYKKVLKTTNANLKRERDKLAEVLQSIRAGFGGQITNPDCGCGDCEFLIKIDTALQSLTNNQND
jgi:hypothetical protein